MKKIALILICACLPVMVFAQTTATIYASGPTGSYTTGSAYFTSPATYTRSDNVIAVTNPPSPGQIQRGYAVFDLSTIPAGAVISNVTLGVNVNGFTLGIYSTCTTIGRAGSLATVTTPSTLYTDCITGTTLWNAATSGAMGTYYVPGPPTAGVGDITMNGGSGSVAATFIQTNAGSLISICFSEGAGGTNVYNFKGEGGSSVTTGPHAPYLQVTYTGTVSVSPITGPTTVCAGSTIALSDATAGGVWSCSNTTVATLSGACVVHGVSAGTAVISYTVSGSTVTTTVTVNSCIAFPPIIGATTVCVGSTTSLSDATVGGAWSSNNTTIATISATGVVYGVTAGTATITYSVSPSIVTATVTVSNTTSPGTISGPSTVYTGGATATLSETVSGGTWSSSNTAVATIDPATGVYTGVSAGTSVITYTVSGCSGIATTTYLVTVTSINGISGHVNFTGAAYTGTVKVWLITYSTALFDLAAVDSSSISCSGCTSVYYQFAGPITDSYRVKAAVVYSPTVTTGYIPTYHTSSYYWNAANVIYHTSGTADINEDINMLSGTVTSGPGFIAGNVTTGANKGTTTGIPVVGLYVYVLDESTYQLKQSTTTDASGNYSFSNLPVGTYFVFPDSLNYLTTAYTGITLTTGAASMSAANFIQHTISKTITPGTSGINNVNNVVSSVLVFPNPTTDELTIKMDNDAYTSCVITNSMGQVLIQQPLTGTQTKVNVKMLPAGLYYITVKGDNGSKVQKFVKM